MKKELIRSSGCQEKVSQIPQQRNRTAEKHARLKKGSIFSFFRKLVQSRMVDGSFGRKNCAVPFSRANERGFHSCGAAGWISNAASRGVTI